MKTTGVYLNKLKMAKIIPIFKTNDNTDPNNYKPISLLCNFNRIFEKLIFKRVESFIEQNNPLSPSQCGFRKTLSAQHAILYFDIVSTIQTNIDKRLLMFGVFIDLRKAFDTVDHKILRHKLDHYRFSGVINKWFSSYLQGQIQTTKIDSYISARKDTTCGVLQGSVFGPLLFLIYVNDIQESSEKLKSFPFSDDTNILYYMLTKILGPWK